MELPGLKQTFFQAFTVDWRLRWRGAGAARLENRSSDTTGESGTVCLLAAGDLKLVRMHSLLSLLFWLMHRLGGLK